MESFFLRLQAFRYLKICKTVVNKCNFKDYFFFQSFIAKKLKFYKIRDNICSYISIFTFSRVFVCVFINTLRMLSKIHHRFFFGNFPILGTFFFNNNKSECLFFLAMKTLFNFQVSEFLKYTNQGKRFSCFQKKGNVSAHFL